MTVSSLLLRSKPWLKMSVLPLAIRSTSTISSSTSFSSSSTECSVHPINRFRLPQQTPPAPKRVPFTVSAHGKTWQDPYHWMRNTDDSDFLNYLELENSYAQAFMADTETLQRSLVSEMKSRMAPDVSTPPERWGPWSYSQYIPEGKEYPVLVRRPEHDQRGWLKKLLSTEVQISEVLLDWNRIAEQYGYVHVGACRVSPDHNFLAYTLDTTGSERYILQIRDLKNSRLVQRLEVEGVVSLAWARDGKTLFYTVSDENQRPYRVLCTNVESNEVDDIEVFAERDASFCVDITSTKDGKFVTVNSNSRTSSEVYVIDAENPLAGLQRLRKRASDVQYFLEHHNGFFYVLTNATVSADNDWSGGGYYLARCPVKDIQASVWKTVICPREDVSLQDMDMFNGHMVLSLSNKGIPMLCSIDMPISTNDENKTEIEDLNPWYLPLPSSPCQVVPGSNHEFMNAVYRVVLSSPVTPDVIVDYDLSRRSFSIVHQEDLLGFSEDSTSCSTTCALLKYSELDEQTEKDKDTQHTKNGKWKDLSDAYVCERLQATSHDGIEVPLTIVYSKKVWKKDLSPGVLLGYGAYGEVLDKSWCPNRLSLLERGWVVAFADVRGGGGGDSSWHKSGSGLLKPNSVHDFVSCGNYLIDKGYVHRHGLGAIGYSAGCTALGAAINMQPDLFRAAILKVPFVDVLNTLLDPTLPLTILDYDEFGNPQLQTDFQSILSYAPYDNIRQDVCYPSMLVTTSLHDSRVGVWEGSKWVARVRDRTCSTCSRSVILKTNMSGGHFGEGGRYALCHETAFDYAFLLKTIENVAHQPKN